MEINKVQKGDFPYYPVLQEDEGLDPLKDPQRDTGFLDLFWNIEEDPILDLDLGD